MVTTGEIFGKKSSEFQKDMRQTSVEVDIAA